MQKFNDEQWRSLTDSDRDEIQSRSIDCNKNMIWCGDDRIYIVTVRSTLYIEKIITDGSVNYTFPVFLYKNIPLDLRFEIRKQLDTNKN